MTSSPVSSTCTPPGQVPSARWAREEAGDLARARRRNGGSCGRSAAVNVLPCMGSQAHTTGWPASRDRARAAAAARSSTCVGAHAGDQREPARDAVGVERARRARAPRRAWRSARPCSRSGCRRRARNSTWAPSSWRVRSPIQSMCAEQSYQSPVSESLAGQRLLVAEDQRLVARVEVDLVELRARLRGRCRTPP